MATLKYIRWSGFDHTYGMISMASQYTSRMEGFYDKYGPIRTVSTDITDPDSQQSHRNSKSMSKTHT